MENTNSMTTLKEVVEKAKEIIAKHLNERTFEIVQFEKSKIEGYVTISFMVEDYKFKASFNKGGYICWHEWQGINQPSLTKEEEKSICDYMWEKWDVERKEILRREIEERQKELEEML